MSKTTAWIQAFRLRTLPLSISGILVGSFIAYKNGFWDNGIFALAILTTLFLQILSNLANDLGDSQKGADNESRVGPKRAVQSGVISAKEMQVGVVIFAILAAATAIPLIFIGTSGMPLEVLWIYIGLGIACIIAAITYTVGRKAYGYNGLGDLMVLIFFGFVSVLGVYSLFSKTFDILVFLPALTIGALSVAVLNLNNMRDQVNDAVVGKITLVVQMGAKNAKVYHGILLLVSFLSLTSYILINEIYISLFALLPYFILLKHYLLVRKNKVPKDLDPELKKVALATFFIALLFSITLMIWS